MALIMNAFATINPATGETIATYDYASDQQIETTIAAAHETATTWRATDMTSRARCLTNLADRLDADATSLAALMTTEMGKSITEAKAEITKCSLTCRHYAEQAPEMLAEQEFANARVRGRVHYAPLGVIYVIMPWNFPFWQAIRFLAPNLMAGNVGILKHSPNVAGCALALTNLVIESGFPTGAFANLFAPEAATDSILADARIAGVTLTGSTRAGKVVAKIAGSHLKKGVFELGGNDPYIGTRLVSLLHEAGVRYIQNNVVFFGGSADNPTFPFVAENLIGVVK